MLLIPEGVSRKWHLTQHNSWNVCNCVGRDNSVLDFFFLVYFFKESLKHIKRIISFQIFLDACICSVPTRAEIRCWVFPYIWIDPESQSSLLGISPVLNRVHQFSQLKLFSAPPGFPPGKANGPCAAYTSPNYRDTQRVAFMPSKPPLLNYLNVPLWSSSKPAHCFLASSWLGGSVTSHYAIGHLQWATI